VKFYRKDDPGRRGGPWRKAWYSTSVGIEVALSIVVGLLLGRFLDGKLDTDPIFMLVGFAAGVTAAGKAIWRVVKREMSDDAGDKDGTGK
jgi:ATP synthase protein I